MKWCRSLFLFCMIAYAWGISAREQAQQDLLKSSDISKIMHQILEHHVEKREISAKVLQMSLVNYINQFDVERLYLLEQDIKPFLNLSEAQLEALKEQYKENNFAIFKQLNEVIQKSIERSRQLRKDYADDARNNLFHFKGKSEPTLREMKERRFAVNDTELKNRLLEYLEAFIDEQRRRYGDSVVAQKKDQILHNFDLHMREHEEPYLYQDENGRPLSEAEQENLFAIHVLKALASSLDAHTSFYQTNEAYDMRVRLQKEFQGIGLVLKDTTDGAKVTHLLENGPAAKSGLIQPGDILIKIDDVSTKEMPFDKVMEKLHDSQNPEIDLLFKRKGADQNDEIYNVKLKREVIILNNDRVDSSYEKFDNGIIGKVNLHSFYQGDGISSEKDVKEAILNLQKKGPLKGLILDLRGNSGGFLSQAVKVAGLFITGGVIVISKYSDGDEKIYRDVDGRMTYDGPLVILTSKMTASAAEIVAQALQDYGVALVVGDEHTYGKGTIQTQTVTENQQNTPYFKVTIGKYYTVSGKTPQKAGVKADILVPGKLNDEAIGEEYLDSVNGDTIPPAYQDNLEDITPDIKSWYLKYYLPRIQHKKEVWRNMVPTLKKNSEYRISKSKNYQLFLKGELPKDKDEEDLSEEEEEATLGKKKKDFGENDLQMDEAVNIIKDMVLLHTLEGSSKK